MKKSIMIGAATLMAAGVAQAAVVSWGSSTVAHNATDETAWMSQAGTLVSAINASQSTNAVLNYGGINWANSDVAEMTAGVLQGGVTIFVGVGNYTTAFGSGQFTEADNFYSGGGYNFSSLTLSNLVVGQEYQLQIMGNDGRGTDTRNTIFGDGTQDYNASITAGTAGNVVLRTDPAGQAGFVIGTFVADATGIQDISVFGNRNADLTLNQAGSTAQFNALQLRAVPEPATFGLLAVFGGGMLFARRRFKR